jgi:hypothetical protein
MPCLPSVGGGLLADRAVRGHDPGLDRRQERAPGLEGAGADPGRRRPLHRRPKPLLAGDADPEGRRHLARGVAAHAVAHDEHAIVDRDHVRVLVVIAHVAHVRRHRRDDRCPHASSAEAGVVIATIVIRVGAGRAPCGTSRDQRPRDRIL